MQIRQPVARVRLRQLILILCVGVLLVTKLALPIYHASVYDRSFCFMDHPETVSDYDVLCRPLANEIVIWSWDIGCNTNIEGCS